MLSVLERRRRVSHLCLAAVLSLAGLAAVILYRFPPASSGFYPLCPVHEYLHLECPGCGTTRALAALLHGRFLEAVRLNALFVVLVLPIGVPWGLLAYVRSVRGKEFRWPKLPVPALYAGVATVAIFAILRNL